MTCFTLRSASQPADPPAACGCTALADSGCGYTEAFGLPALRQAISQRYRVDHEVTVAPSRIAMTMGASGAFILAFLAAFDAGDRVIVTEPGYPAYRNILKALGVEVVALPTDLSTRFQPTPELLERVPGPIDGLILASPSNPTGTILPRPELARLAAWCGSRGIRIVSDEIYHGITYDEPAETILAFAPDAIVVNSFSKLYGMTGWRLGWLVLPEPLVAARDTAWRRTCSSRRRRSRSMRHSAPWPTCPSCSDGSSATAATAGCCSTASRGLGLSRMAPPDGAFYLYLDIGHLGLGSVELCRHLLEDTGVALTPGVDFDPARGGRFVRISFAGAEADVAAAADRLESGSTP